MANRLNRNVAGLLVLIDARHLANSSTPEHRRVFKVAPEGECGHGADPKSGGRAIFGHWVDNGRKSRVEGPSLERVLTQEEAAVIFAAAGATPRWEAGAAVSLTGDR